MAQGKQEDKMKKLLLFSLVFVIIGCATPRIKDTEGTKEYKLSPNQVLNIETVQQIFELDKAAILQIITLTDEQIQRLVEVVKAIDPFGIRINQDMGKFDVEILVEKESLAGSHTQTATTETKPDTVIKLPVP